MNCAIHNERESGDADFGITHSNIGQIIGRIGE